MILHRCTFPSHTNLDSLRRHSSNFIRSIISMDNKSLHQPEELRIIPDVDEVFKQKKTIRTKVRKMLKSMDPDVRSHQDKEIQKMVLEAPWFKSSKGLCAYINCSALREVDTSAILTHILHNGHDSDSEGCVKKKLYVPRVEDKNGHMRMLNITSMDDLVANSMNILEPAPIDANGNQREDVLLANDPVDLLLLPGLAFDTTGRRLGRGGGYYDTFLLSYQKLAQERHWEQPLLVALSYTAQILEEGEIAVTPHDVPIDALVCPTGVIPISDLAKQRIK